MNLRTIGLVVAVAIVVIYIPVTAGDFVHSFASGFGAFLHSVFPHK